MAVFELIMDPHPVRKLSFQAMKIRHDLEHHRLQIAISMVGFRFESGGPRRPESTQKLLRLWREAPDSEIAPDHITAISMLDSKLINHC